MSSLKERHSVVTGIGVIAPNGVSTEAFWKATEAGISVLDRVTREGCEHLPLKVAGEVRGFDPADLIEERYLVQTDRFTHFAMAAANLALDDARLGRADYNASPFAVGVVTAAGSGGGEFGQRELQRLWGQGSRHVGPYQSIAWFYAASTGQISIRGGFKGPCGVVASDEAGGLDALAHACRTIRRGTDAVVVGAAEAPLAPYSVVCQLGYQDLVSSTNRTGHIARSPTMPADSCPPRAARCWYSRRSRQPGAAGRPSGPCSPGTPRPSPAPRGGRSPVPGSPTRSAVRWRTRGAPRRRSTWCSRTRSVSPRPTGPRRWPSRTPWAGDTAQVPVTAPKTGTGRAYCGAPVLDIAAAVLAMENGVVPPTPNVVDVCHDIDVVTGRARPAELRTALVLSRGLMGSNAAMVLRHSPMSPS